MTVVNFLNLIFDNLVALFNVPIIYGLLCIACLSILVHILKLLFK